MSEGLSDELVFAGSVTFAACALVLAGIVGVRWSILLAALKVGVVVVFFAFLNTGAWNLLDDVRYADEAARIYSGGTTAAAAVLAEGESGQLEEVADGRHFGYYVYNIVAMTLFGPHYWSAVFANVFLTCLAARALVLLMTYAGLGSGYRRAGAIFFLVHWDVLAWSSFLNMKDTLVLTLTVWMFAWAQGFFHRRRWYQLPALGLAVLALYFVRVYVPPIVFAALWCAGVLNQRGWRRMALLALPFLGLLALVVRPGLQLPGARVQPGAFLDGAVRFTFTPRPWGIEPNYSFLTFAAILHWIFVPLALWGAIHLWRHHPSARAPIVYAALLVCLYAVVPRLVGPRHRFQGTFVLAWLQYHGLAVTLRQALVRPRRRWAVTAGRRAPELART